jgi:hypothetical protein
MTIRIRYRIPNARLAAGAVSAGQGGGVDQAYDGWRVVSEVEFQQWEADIPAPFDYRSDTKRPYVGSAPGRSVCTGASPLA